MNYGVDTHFYPLGSCTMKYNPKINEDWRACRASRGCIRSRREDAAQGALAVHVRAGARCSPRSSGMDAVSLQPAAGAQGELRGHADDPRLSPRRGASARDEGADPRLGPRHQSRDHGARRLQVVQLEVATQTARWTSGDLERHLDEDVAAFMITEPEHARPLRVARSIEITEMCHAKGGLVYMDGANFNAHPRHHAPGRPRLRRHALQPAQDLHHAAWRRRARGGPGGRQGAPGAVPAGARGGRGRRASTRLDWNRPQSIGKLQAF